MDGKDGDRNLDTSMGMVAAVSLFLKMIKRHVMEVWITIQKCMRKDCMEPGLVSKPVSNRCMLRH